jgi:putative membrane protein
MRRERSLSKGFLSGMMAGLAAAWAMNAFWTLESKLQQRVHDSEHQGAQDKGKREEDNPTVKVAEAIARPLLGRALSRGEKKAGGSLVHYAFGALVGGIYGLLAEANETARSGFGTGYGAAVWLGADEVMVPALKLSPPPQESPLSQHLSGLGAHLVYGATAEAVRRTLRAAA